MAGASLRDANLTDTDFSRAILRSAILVGAKTEAAIFSDADMTGAAIPAEPVLFLKASNTVVGPYDEVLVPRGSTKTDYEAELALVIGRA